MAGQYLRILYGIWVPNCRHNRDSGIYLLVLYGRGTARCAAVDTLVDAVLNEFGIGHNVSRYGGTTVLAYRIYIQSHHHELVSLWHPIMADENVLEEL